MNGATNLPIDTNLHAKCVNFPFCRCDRAHTHSPGSGNPKVILMYPNPAGSVSLFFGMEGIIISFNTLTMAFISVYIWL